MTAERALFATYEEWRKLAEFEGQAIRNRDWPAVNDCQKRLSALQPRLIRLTNDARQEWRRSGLNLAEKEDALRKMVSSLIELEKENSAALSAGKEIVRTQVTQLNTARHNLHRVQRSYSRTAPVLFSSLS